jgi:hypothetical protein
VNETEFVKDEYFVYNVENSDNSDHIEKITHDYFEYEQGHTNIIVKGRLKSNIQFCTKSVCFMADKLLDKQTDGGTE